MKNIFKNLSLVFLFAATTLVSCGDETTTYDVDGGDTVYFFFNSTASVPVSTEGGSAEVKVGVTTRSNAARSFAVTVNAEETTAPANSYSINTSSLVIPAGEYTNSFDIEGVFANIPDGVTYVLTLDLTPTDGYAMAGKEKLVVNIFRSCPTSLAGLYSVTTTYAYHDFLPSFNPHTINSVQIFAGTGVNNYYVNDFSGGLYSVGPYCSAYGTCNLAQNRLNFTVNCGQVSWTNQIEPYGPLEMLSGGVNTYDPATGVITISWFAPTYGEEGVSVYTPL
jgi:hypothetical protein